jgi:hypothetical protein
LQVVEHSSKAGVLVRRRRLGWGCHVVSWTIFGNVTNGLVLYLCERLLQNIEIHGEKRVILAAILI